jgi:6-phosphogluconolactonase
MKRFRTAFDFILLLSAPVVFASGLAAAQDHDYFLYIGTYTGFKYVHHSRPLGLGESHSDGIYVSRYHAATGELGEPELATKMINPSFLTISPNNQFLYAVSEDPLSLGPPLDHSSYVSAFRIDLSTGHLTLLNTVPAGGTSTCFISIDHTGKFVLVSNFGSGSTAVIRVRNDGSLGELTGFIQDVGRSVDPAIQSEPHTHSVVLSPDNRYAIVSDLGTDKVQVFRFDSETGRLSPPEPSFVKVYPGGGPRHFAFDPSGKFGYQLGEMSGAIDVYSWDPSQGKLNLTQRAQSVPHNYFAGNHSAEIEVHPNGKFLYESNRYTHGDNIRGPDNIGVFAINPKDGTLTPVEQIDSGGLIPRNFKIDPSGNFLLVANQMTNNIVVFRIENSTGKLSKMDKELKVDTPVCLKFVPAGG